MSFVDLATLTMHRRAEMESRINTFNEKCDTAINDIKKLKMQTQGFLSQLNCDPAELREQFLSVMKKLDEYMYLMTDFNLAIGQIKDNSGSEYTPVQDISILSMPPASSYSFNMENLMDALSEPAPSTSRVCSNLCKPEKPNKVQIRKEDQALIAFSSSSTSSESVPSRKSEMVTKEVQCSLTEELTSDNIEETSLSSPEPLILPAQTMLEVDCEYHGVITAIAGICFWVITDDSGEVSDFMHDLTEYYQDGISALTVEQARSVTYCAVYDDDKFYYRALYIKEDEEDQEKVSLFLVDTGEIRVCHTRRLRALAPAFCGRPPYARYCHLAGITLTDYNDRVVTQKFENLMNEYLNTPCNFYVDENESESIGVYVTLSTGEVLNDIAIQRGLAAPIDKEPAEETSVERSPEPPAAVGPPEVIEDLDLDAPEYEDPVEAVTGYHNHDEEDICKFYKGSPTKTCGRIHCTKKHIMKHPDGWTLDRVGVPAKIELVPLPEPGKWVKALVTAVPHFDSVYIHLVDENRQTESVPDFGIVLPPNTLQALVRDMNSAATRAAYKPLKFMPAAGEIVAALYPPDGRWYRARVLIGMRADQDIELEFIDYGTRMWVKEDHLRALEHRFMALPAQGVRCVLAGVFVHDENAKLWAQARRALADLVQDRLVHCHVIARGYNELTVELVDDEQYSVSHQLAERGLVELRRYAPPAPPAPHQVVVP